VISRTPQTPIVVSLADLPHTNLRRVQLRPAARRRRARACAPLHPGRTHFLVGANCGAPLAWPRNARLCVISGWPVGKSTPSYCNPALNSCRQRSRVLSKVEFISSAFSRGSPQFADASADFHISHNSFGIWPLEMQSAYSLVLFAIAATRLHAAAHDAS